MQTDDVHILRQLAQKINMRNVLWHRNVLLVVENELLDSGLPHVILRYFNACGADGSGQIGEWHEPETHVIPNILRAVLSGKQITVFGGDYPTADGTCVRDYIHIDDLCEAHWLALKYLRAGGASDVFNLGSESGLSVKELIACVEKVVGSPVPFEIGPRREGDPAFLVSDSGKAASVLGWTPKRTVLEAVQSGWLWEQKLDGQKKAVGV